MEREQKVERESEKLVCCRAGASANRCICVVLSSSNYILEGRTLRSRPGFWRGESEFQLCFLWTSHPKLRCLVVIIETVMWDLNGLPRLLWNTIGIFLTTRCNFARVLENRVVWIIYCPVVTNIDLFALYLILIWIVLWDMLIQNLDWRQYIILQSIK